MGTYDDDGSKLQSGPDTSVTFPLDSNTSISQGPHVYASVGGGSAELFMVDTGSIGIVVSPQFSGKKLKLTSDPFELEYSSSGNAYKGVYAWTTLLFSSARDPSAHGAVTARTVCMRVRYVQQYRAGRDGQWTSKSNVCMLGVGFDRGGSTDSGGHAYPPDLNPFLLLAPMAAGGMVRGFIINTRRRRLTLGLTAANTEGFNFLPLKRQDPNTHCAAKASWAAPVVRLAVPSANIAPFAATLLVDTGLNAAIVQAPLGVAPPLSAVIRLTSADTAKTRVQVADGQTFVVSAEGMTTPLYNFTTGKPGAPDYIEWLHTPPPPGENFFPFVNTSRYALGEFDYLFDDDNGRIGFRP